MSILVSTDAELDLMFKRDKSAIGSCAQCLGKNPMMICEVDKKNINARDFF
jgi:hypothetical protein